MTQAWFTKEFDWDAVRSFRLQVIKFNEIAGKEYNSAFQEKLCTEEVNELLVEYDKKDKAAFLKELCDCFIVSCMIDSKEFEKLLTSAALLDDIDDTCDFFSRNRGKEHVPLTATLTLDALQLIAADWKGAMLEVLSSNMSKFTHYNQYTLEDYDNHCKKLEADGRYQNVKWELSNDYIVWKDGEGKILKGIDYRKADVAKFVY